MADNMIVNGDFDEDRNNWSFTSGGSSVVAEEPNKYCKIYNTESIYQRITLSAGKTYKISVRVRGVVPGIVSIKPLNSNDTYWSTPISAGGSRWSYREYTFTADANWPYPVLHFHASFIENSKEFMELDDIFLSEVD